MTKANSDEWNAIHGVMKGTIWAIYKSTFYIMKPYLKTQKDDFQSQHLKRLCIAWDLAIPRWETEMNLPNFHKNETGQLMLGLRNMLFTILDNDGVYLKFLYQLLTAWEEVKEIDLEK